MNWTTFRLQIICALCVPTILLFGVVKAVNAANPGRTLMIQELVSDFSGSHALPHMQTLELKDTWAPAKPLQIAETVTVTPGPPAPRDDSTTAVINAGRWIDLIQQLILAVLGVVVTFISYKVPAIIRPFFMNKRMKELYTNAVYQMIAKARAAGDIGPDGTMKVDVGSKWLKDVVEYADKNADSTLKEWVGDPVAKAKAFTEMILASTATEYKPQGNPAVPTQGQATNVKSKA